MSEKLDSTKKPEKFCKERRDRQTGKFGFSEFSIFTVLVCICLSNCLHILLIFPRMSWTFYGYFEDFARFWLEIRSRRRFP